MSEQDIVKRAMDARALCTYSFSALFEEAALEIERLRSDLKEAVDALEVADKALDNYADVVDGDSGRPRANAAMQAQIEIRPVLWKHKRAIPQPPVQEGRE